MSLRLHIEDYFTARREDISLPPYRKHDNVFRKQEVGKPFTVYVVFEGIGGLIRDYHCVITPHKIFGITIKDAFRIRLYRGEDNGGSHYFELYNKVHYNCSCMFDYSTLFLKGDGSGERYTLGSYKYVCLDKKDAIAQAKSYNSAIFDTARYSKGEITRFQIKERMGDIMLEIDNENYTIQLEQNSFTVEEIPNVTFSYDDCKSRNGVVCEYLMEELIRKHLKENGRES